jgi:beta-phosphoglucomutase-like phosphatase (HAD superfamily)
MRRRSTVSSVLGLPDYIRGCLFDRDGVLTQTVKIDAAAWKQAFDDFLDRWSDERLTSCRDVLAAAGTAGLFETVIDGHVATLDGLEGKPAPDTFLAGSE